MWGKKGKQEEKSWKMRLPPWEGAWLYTLGVEEPVDIVMQNGFVLWADI